MRLSPLSEWGEESSTTARFPTAMEGSSVEQALVPESHLFCLSRTDWIGRPGVPPTNTQGGVEQKKHAGWGEDGAVK